MTGPERTDRPAIGLRRVEGLGGPAALPASDPGLDARIRDEIRRDGPMTFARFMELALYDPEAGYYAAAGRHPTTAAATAARGSGTAPRGPGREGDFLTAPEGHPIFGWAVARQLEEVWDRLGRPDPFTVREHGAGRGALAIGILDGLRRSDSALLGAVRYQAVETAPARLARLGDALTAEGFVGVLEPADDRPIVGAVLANELVDALPTHAVEGGPDGRLLERFVAADPAGVLGFATGEPSTPRLAARLAADGVALAPGQQAEVCLALDAWCAGVAGSLERGLAVVIDYGHPAARLYAPATGSTIRAYARHRVHADPFVAIGRQDLTAHVDLDAIERALTGAGLVALGRTSQAEFLASLGVGDLLEALAARPISELPAYLEARSALVRMLDPAATGRFAVVLAGRGIEPAPPLRGLSVRLAARRG